MHRIRVLGLLTALLLANCGGKSVAKSGEDPGNGGTSSGTANGGTSSGTANGGALGLERLKSHCLNVCQRLSTCAGRVDAAECSDICVPPVTIAAHTASCARTVDDYFTCLDESNDVCALSEACEAGSEASVACVGEYCRAHPDDRDCSAYSGD